MTDSIDVAGLNKSVRQQMQTPAFAAFGRRATHQGHQVRLGPTVQPARVPVGLFGPVYGGFEAAGPKAATHIGHRVDVQPQRLGDGRIALAVGSGQQNAGVLPLTPRTLVGAGRALQGGALLRLQGDQVHFG